MSVQTLPYNKYAGGGVEPEIARNIIIPLKNISQRLGIDIDMESAIHSIKLDEFIIEWGQTPIEILMQMDAALDGIVIANHTTSEHQISPNRASYRRCGLSYIDCMEELTGKFLPVLKKFLTVFAPEHLQRSQFIHNALTSPQISAHP